MDAIELVIYLTALSVFGPGLIYLVIPRTDVLSVADTQPAT